jgi:hypothetical protein
VILFTKGSALKTVRGVKFFHISPVGPILYVNLTLNFSLFSKIKQNEKERRKVES